MSVVVLAQIELLPGCRDRFLAEFHRLMPLVHAEQGCLEYGPTIDLPSGITRQTPLGDDIVMIVEKWATLPDLEAHLVAPHMTPYRAAVKDWIKSSVLRILQPA